MTIQHRPCAYCSLLLSVILVSTCSWNISSVDVSPLYLKRSKSSLVKPSNPLRSSNLLQTVEFPILDLNVNKSGKSSKLVQDLLPNGINDQSRETLPALKAQEPKVLRRCWFHSSFAQMFDPILNSKLDYPKASEESQEPLKTDRETPIATPDTNKSDDGAVKKPKRQLNTLLSPLWTPIRRLSSLKSPGCSLAAKNPETSTIKIEDSQHTNGSIPNSPSHRNAPQKYHRSSFSRPPLIYTYFFRHVINLIKSFLPSFNLPMIYRLIAILRQNMPHIPRIPRWVPVKALQNNYARVSRLVNGGLDFSKPFYLKWRDVFAVRIVIGTPPPVMMAKP